MATAARIGDFKLHEQLHAGRNGVIHAGNRPLDRRSVAIKIIHITGDASDTKEMQIMQLLQTDALTFGDHCGSENVMRANSVVVDEVTHRIGLAMEMMSHTLEDTMRNNLIRADKRGGGDFQNFFKPSSKICAHEQVIDVWTEVLKGLTYIHSKGVVHHDICPSNIFISHSGQVKIGDFGRARFSAAGLSLPVLGDVQFVAPELLNGEIETSIPASDMWSAGVVMLHHFLSNFKTSSREAIGAELQLDFSATRPLISSAKRFETTRRKLTDTLLYAAYHGQAEVTTILTTILGFLNIDPKARLTAKEARTVLK